MLRACLTCLYRGDHPDRSMSEFAICRRNPPTVLPGDLAAGGTAAEVVTVWPIIDPNEDWCGEYATRPLAHG